MSKFNFSDYLAAVRASGGWSMAELGRLMAEAVGRKDPFSASYVNELEKGRREPTEDTITALAPVAGVDAAWLQAMVDIERLGERRVRALLQHASGADAPRLERPTADERIVSLRNRLPGVTTGDRMRDELVEPFWDDPRQVPFKKVLSGKTVKLAMRGTVGANRRRLLERPKQIAVPAELADGADWCVDVVGDSMNQYLWRWKPLVEGSRLYVRGTDVWPAPGTLVVADVGDGVVVKVYQRRKGRPLLESHSTVQHAPIPVEEGVTLLGEVIEIEPPRAT